MNSTRKPFVAPTIKEEASLASVTLISGGGPTRHGPKNGGGGGGGPTNHTNTSHGHGNGHGS